MTVNKIATMSKLNYFLAILFILMAVLPATAQRDERRRTGDQAVEQVFPEGLIYALPRNGLLLKVEMIKEDFFPGPYHQYARKYLGIDNVGSANTTKWTITGIDMTVFSEPDPKAYFKVSDVYPVAIAQLPNGIISAINAKGTEAEDQLVGGSLLPLFEKKTTTFTDLSSDDFYDLNIEPSTGTEKMVAKSQEEKAREAAEYIMRLRKKRSYKIINPSDIVPEDGEGYMAFIDEARRLDNEYVSLFTGKTVYSKHEATIIYVPDEANVKNDVVFRFSDEKGVLPKADMSGKPVYININKEQDAFNTISKLRSSDNPISGKQGINYRVSGQRIDQPYRWFKYHLCCKGNNSSNGGCSPSASKYVGVRTPDYLQHIYRQYP
jgi:hypothetical protein